MASVHDVAAYILKKKGKMTAMKLEKLAYYSQAWSLVWDEKPLFPEKIEAWISGPVAPALYQKHRGQFQVLSWPLGRISRLKPEQKETIEAVLKHYGNKSSQYLSDLTHAEDPWRKARKGLADNERGNREISHAAMAEYYESLPR